MPKISAASVEEHVERQTETLLDTANRLFREQGYMATDMGDIAKAMGLKRNSLYRYYQNKERILIACLRRSIEPHIAKEKKLAAKIDDPVELLDRLLDVQIDFATGEDHASMNFMEDIRKGSTDLRREIGGLYADFRTTLTQTINQILQGQKREADVVTALVIGMVQSASLHILRHQNKTKVKNELKTSVRLLLNQKGRST